MSQNREPATPSAIRKMTNKPRQDPVAFGPGLPPGKPVNIVAPRRKTYWTPETHFGARHRTACSLKSNLIRVAGYQDEMSYDLTDEPDASNL